MWSTTSRAKPKRSMSTLLDMFDDHGVAVFTSAYAAAAVEAALRDQGFSFKTRIVKTRKRGLEYRIKLLDGY